MNLADVVNVPCQTLETVCGLEKREFERGKVELSEEDRCIGVAQESISPHEPGNVAAPEKRAEVDCQFWDREELGSGRAHR